MSQLSSFIFSAYPNLPSIQLQPDFAGLSWGGWLLILLLVILVVWWLITRQVKYSPSIEESTFDHADKLTLEHPQEAVILHPIEPLAVVIEAPQPVAAVLEPEPMVSERVPPVLAPSVPEAAPIPDNLEVIEGIGPKIATILQAEGIATFAQLGAAAPPQLLTILHASGLRVNDPTTWPEQARLAAAGDWEGLQKFQATLKAGRRIENL